MSVDSYKCALDPITNTTLQVYLFRNVKNVEIIKNNVIKGIWKCAVIKPSLILDLFQVVVAANRALLSQRSQTMITKTVYSEILYNLSLTKNISQSLSKFGIENDNNILVCFLDTDNVSGDIIKEIDGELCPVADLATFTNIRDVKNVYKLNNVKNEVDFIDIIVSKMVTKGFVNH